tara:strand:- start:944 stop:1117 length:174 start_codon:yes stop_codon:yes gene_type:complete
MKFKGKRSEAQVEEHKISKHPLLSGDAAKIDEYIGNIKKTEDIVEALRVMAMSIKPK